MTLILIVRINTCKYSDQWLAYNNHCLNVSLFFINSYGFKLSLIGLSRPKFSTKVSLTRTQISSPGDSISTSRSISSHNTIFLSALFQEWVLPSCPCQGIVLNSISCLNLYFSPSLLLIHFPRCIWNPSWYLWSCSTPSILLTAEKKT